MDSCPAGDKSGNFYDGKCTAPVVGSGTTTNETIVTTTTGTGESVVITRTPNNIIVTTKTQSGDTTVTFVKPPLTLFTVSAIRATDITESWAKIYIQKLIVRSVVNNSEKFNPDSNLTRAEFLKISMNAAGWKIGT